MDSKMVNANFENLMKILNICLNFIGFNVFKKQWFCWKTVLVHLTKLSLISSSIIVARIEIIQRNMNVVSTAGVLLFGGGVVYVKILLFVIARNSFREAIEWLERVFKDPGNPTINKLWHPILKKCCRITIIVQKFFYSLFLGFSLTMILIRLVQNARNLPLEFYIPYLEMDNLNVYACNYVYQILVLLIIIHGSGAIDGIFVTVIYFSTARFELISQCLRTFTSETSLGVSRMDQRTTLIKNIIALHSDVLWAVNKFSSMFESILLFQILASIGSQVFTFFIIQEDTSNFIMWCVSIATVVQIFLYCFFGNLLVQKAEEMCEEIYCTTWYDMEKHQKTMLLLMLRKSQKPVGLSIGGFGELSLVSFVAVVKAAFSYCAVLQSVNS